MFAGCNSVKKDIISTYFWCVEINLCDNFYTFAMWKVFQ